MARVCNPCSSTGDARLETRATEMTRGLEPNYRALGLLCAVRTCATVVKDLLARHPNAEALRATSEADDGAALSDLLWRELADAERATLRGAGQRHLEPPRGSAVQYWHRR